MAFPITKDHVETLVGKEVVALTRDGAMVRGTLVRRQGNRLYIRANDPNRAHTSAFIPLVLYDLLAIGAYGGYGGFGYPYGGFGYPGFFW